MKDRLYHIYKDAHVSSSSFSVLCHGFPVQENIMFSYHEDGKFRGKPKDTKLINFHVSKGMFSPKLLGKVGVIFNLILKKSTF